MAKIATNGIEIEFESIGDEDGPAVILIAGWGAQLIVWPDVFCDALAARGFRVIRFDNRDVGLSAKIEDGTSYALEDMAADAVGLLDALGIGAAHFMGQSMGGMIAQVAAIRYPERVLSLTSIMSTTGARGVGQPSDAARARFTVPAGATPEERVATSIASCLVNWGDSVQFPFDAALARWRTEVSDGRCYYPEGRLRQVVAMQATGDRTEALEKLHVPALVIHGDNDGLVHVSGGVATAAAIPGAELVIIEGMGHVVDGRTTDTMLRAFDQLVARAAATTGR